MFESMRERRGWQENGRGRGGRRMGEADVRAVDL